MRYLQCLEAITALQLEDAKRHLELFSAMLTSSMQFVDQRLDELIDVENGESEAIRMIRADHMILGRTTRLADEALSELELIADNHPNNLRSEMVQRLDIFVRLNNILRQHQLREHESLFPLFALNLDDDKGQELADLFTRSMQRARPH